MVVPLRFLVQGVSWLLMSSSHVSAVKRPQPPSCANLSSLAGRELDSSFPCHVSGAIILTIMWASAFSSLLIISMKKM